MDMLEKYKKILSEALVLKKDTANKKLIVVSNTADEKVSKQETYWNKNELKEAGFTWNGKLGAWEIDSSEFSKAKDVINQINQKRKYTTEFVEDVEKLEEFVAALSAPGTDKNNLKEKISMYVDDLSNVTDEQALSSEIRRYLTFFSKFKGHSMYNTLLIYLQNKNATRVAGFRQWEEKFHRHVKKGAKGMYILAPRFFGKGKTSEANKELDNAVEKGNPQGFFPVTVFDISDTEPIDERGEVPSTPVWFGENEPSAVADKLFEYVKILADKLGIKVTQDDARGGEKGFSANKHINLSSDISGVAQISTMIHEIAHELMHWKTSSPFYIDAENKMDKNPKAMRELQAESVSYVVLKHYDLPTSHHPTYLALWKANKEKIKQNLDVIQKVSAYLIEKIDDISEKQEGREPEAIAEPEEINEIRKVIKEILLDFYK